MKFAIRVLNQFGDSPRSVYDVLSRKFTEVEVHEELKPYLHYHCLVEATGMDEKQVKKTMYNLKPYQVNKLIRSKNNLNVQLVSNEPEYKLYIRKENGRCYSDGDSKIEQDIFTVDNSECQFTD